MVPIIESIKQQVTTLYDDMITLGKKLLAEAREFLDDFVIVSMQLLEP